MQRKLLVHSFTQDSKPKIKTNNNVKVPTSDEQLRGFVDLYSSLSKDLHYKTTVVESRTL